MNYNVFKIEKSTYEGEIERVVASVNGCVINFSVVASVNGCVTNSLVVASVNDCVTNFSVVTLLVTVAHNDLSQV